MPHRLETIAMEIVLKRGLARSPLLPARLRRKLARYFFEELFISMAERLQELALNLVDPEADDEDFEELLAILKTFDSIGHDFDIPFQNTFVEATYELIHSAMDLEDIVERDIFIGYMSFLEYLVLIFVDDSFILPNHEDYTVEVMVYHLRHAMY